MTENDISYKIIGAAIEVHRNLGPGLLEKIYEKCNDKTERVRARFDYKTKADSLETILKLERENTKQQKHTGQQTVKQARIENRGWFWTWVFVIVAFILGFIVHRNIFSTL